MWGIFRNLSNVLWIYLIFSFQGTRQHVIFLPSLRVGSFHILYSTKTTLTLTFPISWILLFVMQIFSSALFMIIWNKVVSHSNIVNHLLSITYSWFCYCNDFLWVHIAECIRCNVIFFYSEFIHNYYLPRNNETIWKYSNLL